jgi:hypothetical protein
MPTRHGYCQNALLVAVYTPEKGVYIVSDINLHIIRWCSLPSRARTLSLTVGEIFLVASRDEKPPPRRRRLEEPPASPSSLPPESACGRARDRARLRREQPRSGPARLRDARSRVAPRAFSTRPSSVVVVSDDRSSAPPRCRRERSPRASALPAVGAARGPFGAAAGRGFSRGPGVLGRPPRGRGPAATADRRRRPPDGRPRQKHGPIGFFSGRRPDPAPGRRRESGGRPAARRRGGGGRGCATAAPSKTEALLKYGTETIHCALKCSRPRRKRTLCVTVAAHTAGRCTLPSRARTLRCTVIRRNTRPK